MNRPSCTDPVFGGTITDIPVSGGTIRVESLGYGRAILFLHGWTLDRRIWEPQARALADRYRIVTLDRRGFGESSAPPALPQEPADILAIADALGLERFALVGMSQGARIALRFAIAHPGRVSAIVLQGAPLSDVPGADEETPIVRMTDLLASGQLEEMRRICLAHPLMRVAGEGRALLERIASGYSGRDLATPSTLEVTSADCAVIQAPVLAITGGNESAWRHRVARTLKETAGAARLDIPDCGHLCNLERPDIYNAAIVDFLEQRAAAIRPRAA
ncbi:alpha/beta fold hydrolase [Sphingomonas sp.]|uniref:alpha/beta fold hydrolase n=1 Tax=Sphingomonas sp. TaxID=28214 RepID=UPI002DD69247|nr:alpha/beta hydrolase [Sphingomonas sp.]